MAKRLVLSKVKWLLSFSPAFVAFVYAHIFSHADIKDLFDRNILILLNIGYLILSKMIVLCHIKLVCSVMCRLKPTRVEGRQKT